MLLVLLRGSGTLVTAYNLIYVQKRCYVMVIWGPSALLYIQNKFSHFYHPCHFTTSVALCHLNNSRAALLQPEAFLIACVTW